MTNNSHKKTKKDNDLFSKVQLMTYPDSLGGNLATLKNVLETSFDKAVGFVHILPPYPSSGDRGFAPLTHLEIEPKWGKWKDIQKISEQKGLMLDIIAGHVSVESKFFEDYLQKGEKSQYYDMFARIEKTFPDGIIKIDELEKFGYLTPIPPMIIFKLKDGKCKIHFKTFMPTQADLDLDSTVAQKILTEFIQNHAKMGVKMVRLDAVETVCKDRNLGFHLVPHTFEIMQWLIDTIKENGMEVLCEVFGEEKLKNKIVKMGAWIYDFNLPDIILHAVLSQKSHHLKSWFAKKSQNIITVLTNHDGFMTGRILQSLSPTEAAFTRSKMLENAGSLTQKASGVVANNIATDGINGTLLEVVGHDQEKWLIAHILHLFAPGTPQVYYNDILAQANDLEAFKETGEGRSLIRHNFSTEELTQTLKIPPVEKMIKLMEFRNNFQAFDGSQKVFESGDHELIMTWQKGEYQTKLTLDLFHFQYTIEYQSPLEEVKTWGLESQFEW